MATLNINGQRVTVDDSFLSLSPEEQEATVNEIAASLSQQQEQSPAPSTELPTVPLPGQFNQQNMSRSFLNAVPIIGPTLQGAFDEVQAQGTSLLSGRPVEDTRQFFDWYNRGVSAGDPVGGGTASVAGTVLPLAVAGAAIPAVGAGLGMTGNLGMRTIFGGLSGAGIAGADTFARTGDPGASFNSAAVGGVLGGAAPAAFRGLGMLRNTVFPNRQPGPTLNRALRDDGITPQEVPARLQALGPDAMIADLGPNLQRQAGALASIPGAAQQTIRSAVAARNAPTRVNARIQEAIEKTLGRSSPAFVIADDVVRQQSAASDPLYAAIRMQPVTPDGNMAFVLSTQEGKRFLQQAAREFSDDMRAWHPDELRIAGYGDAYNFSGDNHVAGLLDYVKRKFDSAASEAYRAGNNYLGGRYANYARLLRTEMDVQVRGYQAAREAFAGPASVLEALDEGQTVFATGRQQLIHPQQLQSRLEAMSQSERDAYLQGAQSAIQDLLGTARNDARKVQDIFRSGYNVEKLRILIGDEATDELLRAVNFETVSGQTTHVVTGNSETAARQSAIGEVAPELARTQRPAAILELVIRAFDKARGLWTNRSQAANNQSLARVLASGQPIPDSLVQQMYRRPPPMALPPATAGLLATPQ